MSTWYYYQLGVWQSETGIVPFRIAAEGSVPRSNSLIHR